ncbi:MAG: response regulator [Chlorobiaceae bacterium]|nr:response regulator [Chlorobiaceae bacterium]
MGRICSMLTTLIRENIKVKWKPNCPKTIVNIDPSSLVQIITILYVNARDAISDTGNITIETDILNTSQCSEQAVSVPGSNCDLVRISVSDTGCGMPKSALPHIFEPFFTTKAIGEGTGLGLSTVYGLVNQNGGFIKCQSKIGKGTTFRILFPLSPITDKTLEPSTMISPDITHDDLVLVVEDEPQILSIIKTILEKQGLNVLTTENAEKRAQDFFKNHGDKITLVISDIMMTGMSGIEMSHELMKINPKTKFIFMTGYSTDAASQYGLISENSNFIAKPFGIQNFSWLVTSMLDNEAVNVH